MEADAVEGDGEGLPVGGGLGVLGRQRFQDRHRPSVGRLGLLWSAQLVLDVPGARRPTRPRAGRPDPGSGGGRSPRRTSGPSGGYPAGIRPSPAVRPARRPLPCTSPRRPAARGGNCPRRGRRGSALARRSAGTDGPRRPRRRPRRRGVWPPSPSARRRPVGGGTIARADAPARSGGPGSAGARGTVPGRRRAPPPIWYRPDGSLRRHFRQIVSRSRGKRGTSRLGGTGSALRTCSRVSNSVAALERRPARQQLVEDGSQGVDVDRRARMLRLAPGLLGRHVAGRAEDLLGSRQARVGVHAPWRGRSR